MLPGNPAPAGGLFGNKNGQKPIGGGLFGNPPQKPQGNSFAGPPKTPSFGSANPVQNQLNVNDTLIYGTKLFLGKSHIYQNRNGDSYTGITGGIKNYTLEELRIKDYSLHIRQNFLSPEKTWLDAISAANISKRDGKLEPSLLDSSKQQAHISPFGGIVGGSQPALQTNNPQNTQTAHNNPVPNKQDTQVPQATGGGLFGNKPAQINPVPLLQNNQVPQATRGGLFGNKPAQTNPVPVLQNTQVLQPTGGGLFGNKPAQTNHVPNKQSSQVTQPTGGGLFGNKPTQINSVPSLQSNQDITQQTQSNKTLLQNKELSPHPVIQSSSVKPSEEVKEAGIIPEKKTVVLNADSFSGEMNKMMLVLNFISLLQSHKISVPENLLNKPDFVPRFFKFLEEHDMTIPMTNIPQFQLNNQEEKPGEIKVSRREAQESTLLVELSSALRKEEEKIPEEEVLPQPTDEMKALSLAEPQLSLIKEEESEEEKVEIQKENGEGEEK